jgi:hypothetical protein
MAAFWNPENAIVETELAMAVKKKAVEEFSVIESKVGFYISVKFTWREEELHLASRRDRSQPKYYTDAGRLFKYILTKFHVTHFQVYLLPHNDQNE